jgi:hypothetical protein
VIFFRIEIMTENSDHSTFDFQSNIKTIKHFLRNLPNFTETVSEQLDLAAIMPSEKVMTAVARSVTVQDEAKCQVQVAKPQIVGEGDNGEEADASCDEDGDDFWHTSVGKFKFSIDALPQPLQYIHQLLIELPNVDKPDILYFMLQCLNTMVLHGDAFAKAARDHRGFFIWCQENLLIKK